LATDKETYLDQEVPELSITAAEDCHLRLLYQDARGDISVLFPNQFITDDRIRAGRQTLMPVPNPQVSGEEVAIQIYGGDDGTDFGTETLIAVATDQPFTDIAGLLAELKKTPFAGAGTDQALAITKAARAISRAARPSTTGSRVQTPTAAARSGMSVVTIHTQPKPKKP
jgi:hypothetical protein